MLVLSCELMACERREQSKVQPGSSRTVSTKIASPPVVVDSIRCEPGYKAFALRAGGALCVQPAGRSDRSDPAREHFYANSVLRATLDEADVFVGSTPYPEALLLSIYGPSPIPSTVTSPRRR